MLTQPILRALGDMDSLGHVPDQILALIVEFSKADEFGFDFNNCTKGSDLYVFEMTFGRTPKYADMKAEEMKVTYTHFPTDRPDIVKGTSLEGRNLIFFARGEKSNNKSFLPTNQIFHQTAGVRHYRLATVDGRFYCGATVLDRKDAETGKTYVIQGYGFTDPSSVMCSKESLYSFSQVSLYSKMSEERANAMSEISERLVVNMSLDYDNWKIIFRSAYDPSISFSVDLPPFSPKDLLESPFGRVDHGLLSPSGRSERISENKARLRPKNCSIVPAMYTWWNPLVFYPLTESEALTQMNRKEEIFWETWIKSMLAVESISTLKKDSFIRVVGNWLERLDE